MCRRATKKMDLESVIRRTATRGAIAREAPEVRCIIIVVESLQMSRF
jgi:hypothetical protein